tara:strand:+ start:1111 stop:1251 length:141 start_codon:yes stop_codon:yes gene_type:complete
MPTYLRNFYYKKLLDVKDTEKRQLEKQEQKNSKLSKPSFKNSNFKR